MCDVCCKGSPAGNWAAPAPNGADASSPHQRHFSVSFAVMNNYQAAAAAAQGFGPPASPHAAASTRAGFPAANSPGPTIDMYSSSAADTVAGYVQAASPQPSGFPAIAVSRAPLNYSPVNITIFYTNFSFFFFEVIFAQIILLYAYVLFWWYYRVHWFRPHSPTAITELSATRNYRAY